jgi:hypothetical protein
VVLAFQLANIAGVLFVMGANGYSVISPLDVYYTGKETYFTPAPWAFFLWYETCALPVSSAYLQQASYSLVASRNMHLPVLRPR